MTRLWLSLSALALAACAPAAPPAQGVGFGSYESYTHSPRAARTAQLETPLRLSAEATGAPPPSPTAPRAVTAAELAAAGINTSGSVIVRRPDGTVIYAPQSRPILPPAQRPENTNDEGLNPAFEAQAPEEPVEEAAAVQSSAPLSALRPGAITNQEYAASDSSAVRQVTTPLPERPTSVGADVVQFALSTNHAVGTKTYRRRFASEAKAQRACARYTGQDQAQRAFLEAGGPQRDRLGLDPDGDGFACAWSPEPFRAARSG